MRGVNINSVMVSKYSDGHHLEEGLALFSKASKIELGQ